MRTLPADLTTAQRSASAAPHLEIRFRSRDGAVDTTYKTDDATNRVSYVKSAEGKYGGLIGVPDTLNPISTVIRLRDQDNALNVLDYKGYRVDIGWGFDTTSGKKVSEGPPVFVIEQRTVSAEGELYAEYYCMSLWELLRTIWTKQTATARITYAGDVDVQHILMELLAGSELAACVMFNASTAVYTDYLAASVNPTNASNLGTAGDVTLFATGESPAVGDIWYTGLDALFNTITYHMQDSQNALSEAHSIEYWNGSAWTAVSNPSGTSSGWFDDTDQIRNIFWENSSDWAKVNLRTQTGSSTFPDAAHYYVRVTITAISSPTQNGTMTKIWAGQDFGFTLDTATAGQGESDQPTYNADFGQNVSSIIMDIIAETLLVIRVEKDGFHAFFADNSLTPVDYTYNSDHAFRSNLLRTSLIIPNSITYTNLPPGQIGTRFSGTSTDSTSVGRLGTFDEIRLNPDLTSNSAAATAAANAIKRILRDVAQGIVLVPMNVGQEIWDLVSVADARSGQTITGRVTRMVREYDPAEGIYNIDITMGAVTIESTPDLIWTSERPNILEGTMRRRGAQESQAETTGPGGKWTGGDGAVVIDSKGLTIISTTGVLTIESTAGVSEGIIFGSTGLGLVLSATNGGDVTLAALGAAVLPVAANDTDFGSSSVEWAQGYFNEVRFTAPTGNYLGFDAGTQSAQVSLTLPDGDGSADQVIKTNGSGVLTWADSGGIPSYDDDVLLQMGTDNDSVRVLRSTILAANTPLTNVLVGTPRMTALPANTLIESNITVDGDMVWATVLGGTHSTEALRFDTSAGEIVFNDASQDWDFRIESDGNANMLVIDAGLNSIGMGAAAAGNDFLTISPAFTSNGVSATARMISIAGSITGAVGDTTHLVGTIYGSLLITQTATENIGDTAQVFIAVPSITDNLTGDIITASALKVIGVPNQGITNYGILIDHAGRDGIGIGLRDNFDVMTGLSTIVLGNRVNSGDYLTIEKAFNTTGGAHFQILSEIGLANPLIFDTWGGAPATTDTSSSLGAMNFFVGQHNGSNADVDMVADSNAIAWGEISSAGARLTRMLLKADDGELNLGNTTLVALDNDDDVMLVRDMQRAASLDNGINITPYDQGLPIDAYNRLRAKGLAGEKDESGFFLFPLQARLGAYEGTMFQLLEDVMSIVEVLTAKQRKRLTPRVQARLTRYQLP